MKGEFPKKSIDLNQNADIFFSNTDFSSILQKGKYPEQNMNIAKIYRILVLLFFASGSPTVFSSDIISGYFNTESPEILHGEWRTDSYADSRITFTVNTRSITVKFQNGSDWVEHKNLTMICRKLNKQDCVLVNKVLNKFLMKVKFDGPKKFTVSYYLQNVTSNKNPGGVHSKSLELRIPDGALYTKK